MIQSAARSARGRPQVVMPWMCEARQRMRIERKHRPGQQAGRSIAVQDDDERRRGPRAEREPRDEHDVEYQDRRSAEPPAAAPIRASTIGGSGKGEACRARGRKCWH